MQIVHKGLTNAQDSGHRTEVPVYHLIYKARYH